jgi:hypothetical protein
MFRKKGFLVIIAVILFTAIFPGSAFAQGPSGNWTSNISCQNQDDNIDAVVNLVFYEEDTGNDKIVATETIPAGKSMNFVITNLPTGSKGSLVVSSNTPVTCAVDHSKNATGTTSNPYRFAASKGFEPDEIGPTMYVSQVEKDFWGWNSYIAIQNTSSTETDVTVSFVNRYGNSYPDVSFTIPGSSNHILYLDEIETLPSMFIGGATIVADDGTTPLAVTAAFYNDGSSSTTSQIHAFNGATTGSNIIYAPYIVRNYYGYQSGITIQNVGDTKTSFKIVFTFNNKNFTYQYPRNLKPGEIKDLYLPNVVELDPVDDFSVVQRYGKAIIKATDTAGAFNPSGSLIGNINQDNRGGTGIPLERAGQGATYSAFLSNRGTQTAYLAKVMRNVNGFSSGFHVSNFSGTNGSCTFSFVDDPNANFTQTIKANSYITKYAPNIPNLDDGYNAGVIIECNVNVFVIVNAAVNPTAGRYGDSFYQMSTGTESTP